jgi:polysaccharide export outer membrane protein
MKHIILIIFLICAFSSPSFSEDSEEHAQSFYKVGIGDIIDVAVLQPEKLAVSVTVAPDGTITLPYIGNVAAENYTLPEIEKKIQEGLAKGYMKYPIVSISLKQCLSKKFFVYGEVVNPGTYFLNDDTTVLKAVSIAGGFTKYGSASNVKILRQKEGGPGYENIKVNIKSIMDGKSSEDVVLEPGDIVVVSEGIF